MRNGLDPMPVPEEAHVDDADDGLPPALDDAPVSPLEAEENLAASDAEESMTRALSALKHRGQRAVAAVEHAITPRRVVIGVSVAVGVSAVLLFALSRRGRRRPRTLAGTIARSLAREVVGRIVLGAATTAGARIAEAAVPMLVAAIANRQTKRSRPSRARKTRARIDDEDVA
jgi:hypothetical protein